MNMPYTSAQFVSDMEDHFGNYKDAMSNTIKIRLRMVREPELRELAKTVLDTYQLSRPPSWAYIKEKVIELKLVIDVSNYFFVSHCEHCKQEFSIDEYWCPHCKEPRKYGLVKKKPKNNQKVKTY